MSVLEQYADLKVQIAELEKEAKALQPAVLEEVKKAPKEKAEVALGAYTITHRNKWKYSEHIDELTKDLKVAKIDEEEKGIATCTQSEILTFKQLAI